jgi:hypothetical protein
MTVIKTQTVAIILLWIFLAILYVLQFDTTIIVRSNRTMIKQNRDSTATEHGQILKKQDTILKLLKN